MLRQYFISIIIVFKSEVNIIVRYIYIYMIRALYLGGMET